MEILSNFCVIIKVSMVFLSLTVLPASLVVFFIKKIFPNLDKLF